MRLGLLAAALVVPPLLTWLLYSDAEEAAILWLLWSLPSALAGCFVASRYFVPAAALAFGLSALAAPVALGYAPGYLLQPLILLILLMRNRHQDWAGNG